MDLLKTAVQCCNRHVGGWRGRRAVRCADDNKQEEEEEGERRWVIDAMRLRGSWSSQKDCPRRRRAAAFNDFLKKEIQQQQYAGGVK